MVSRTDPSGAEQSQDALRASKCPHCTVVSYPHALSCPGCGADAVPYDLSERGTVWSWTVQRYAPKSPPYVVPDGGHVPFVVAYIEVNEGIRVEAVVEATPEEVSIGMPVRLRGGDGVPRASVRGEW